MHHTIHARTRTVPTALPRVLLTFSRRRLPLKALQYFDLKSGRDAEVQIDLECDEAVARDLVAQIARIVEVTEVWSERVAPAKRATSLRAA